MPQWNSMFFAFSFIIEGTTEKVLQFIIPSSQFTTKTLVSLNKKCIVEHYREVQTIKYLLIDIIFVKKNIFLVTFSELPPIGLC
jgi:hypothetical protein